MSAAATYTILLVAAYTMTVLLAAWLCLQLIMWVLSFNIRRILALRNRTACDYLEKGRFWKDGGNRYVQGVVGVLFRHSLADVTSRQCRGIADDSRLDIDFLFFRHCLLLSLLL